MTVEMWRAVVGYEGRYEVSSSGRVRSVPRTGIRKDGSRLSVRGQILKPWIHPKTEYLIVGRGKGEPREYVHRLVALAFLGPEPEGMEVCHEDGKRWNNTLANLRWDTRSSNQMDRVAHGTRNFQDKTHCPLGHELVAPNLRETMYARDGHRGCKACARGREYVRRHGGDMQKICDWKYDEIMNEVYA